MSAQAGRDILMKLANGAGGFETVAGLRSKTLRFNAQLIDVTGSQSLEAWRELLPGAGVKSVEITGAGIFRDKASDALIRHTFFNQSFNVFQFIMPDFGTIEGPFLMSTLSYTGDYQGEAQYELSVQSAGVTTFTAFS